MGFLSKDFMLKNEPAKRLYNGYARDLPIIDYHCHLDPKKIADNTGFLSITELMLGGDHYKWRAMRSCGIDEKYITGDASDSDKFRMWARTTELAIGNPLYHWTHLELSRYFGINTPLCEANADEIFDLCNEQLKGEDFKPRRLIERSNAKVVCTTDSPLDDLRYHRQLACEFTACRVLPTFRPDIMLDIASPKFLAYISGTGIKSYDEFLRLLSARIDYFDAVGCKSADHGLGYVPYMPGDAAEVFDRAVGGGKITADDENIFKTAVMDYCAGEYHRLGWVLQLHLGAMRNNNTLMFERLGTDIGFDSMNDLNIAYPLSRLLDMFSAGGHLPKTVLYSLNPKDNYVLGTMLGNFQSAPEFGRLQLGSGWWFNDQRDGIESQLKTLANLGILSTFVGMLTDSRSLISYPRHEYFRRILCNLLGQWVDDGEYPEDYEALGRIVSGICYNNVKAYFGF